MVLQNTGTISHNQIITDSAIQYSQIVDTNDYTRNVYSSITGSSIGVQKISGSGILPPEGEYAITLSPSTTAGNYISFSSYPSDINNWSSINFTVECWIYPTAFNTNGSVIIGLCQPTGSLHNWRLQLSANGFLQFIYNTVQDGIKTVSTTTPLNLNSWSHVFMSYNFTDVTIYIGFNGSNVVRGGLSGTPAATSIPLTIGQFNSTTTFIGSISCLRILGNNCLYTSNYTIPYFPLVKLTGTLFLLRANAKNIVDLTGNFGSIIYSTDGANTIGGLTYINNPQSNYYGNQLNSPPSTDGAIYLNGSTCSYSVNNPLTNIFLFNWWQTGLTVETWVNYQSFSNTSYYDGLNYVSSLIGLMSHNSSTHYWSFGADDIGRLVFAYNNGSLNYIYTTNTLNLNTWYNIALTYTNNRVYIFINGILIQNSAISGTPQVSSCNFTIGQYNTSYNTNALISNMRVLNTCLYTSNYVPSKEPFYRNSNNILLLRATPMLIYTSNVYTGLNNIMPYLYLGTCGTKISNINSNKDCFPPGGDGVIHLNSSSNSSGIDIPYTVYNSSYNFTNGMTVECWVNYETLSNASINSVQFTQSNDLPMLIRSNLSLPLINWTFGATIKGNLSFCYYASSNITVVSTSEILNKNIWYHIAVSINASNIFLFINGNLVKTATIPISPTINSNTGLAFQSTCYISNIRIVNATLYTSNFTPSNIPLQISTIGTTPLLLRVPPTEILLSQMNLSKSNKYMYKDQLNVPQVIQPTPIILLTSAGLNVEALNTTNLPTYDTTGSGPTTFNGSTQYIALPPFKIISEYGFTISLTFSYTSSTATNSVLFMMGNNKNNFIALIYSAANTLTLRTQYFSNANLATTSGTGITSTTVSSTLVANQINNVIIVYRNYQYFIYVNNPSTNPAASVTLATVPSGVFTTNYIGCGITGTQTTLSNFSLFSCYSLAIYNKPFLQNDTTNNIIYDIGQYTASSTSYQTNANLLGNALIDNSQSQSLLPVITSNSTTGIGTTTATITLAGTNLETVTLYYRNYYFNTASIVTSFSQNLTPSSGTVSLTGLSAGYIYEYKLVPQNTVSLPNPMGIFERDYSLNVTTNNLVLWIDASNYSSALLNVSNITTMYDLSPQSNNMTNSGAVIYRFNAINGRPAIDFTSANSRLVSGSFPTSYDLTVAIVTVIRNIASNGMIWGHYTSARKTNDISICADSTTTPTQLNLRTNNDTSTAVSIYRYTPVIMYGTLSNGNLRNLSLQSLYGTANILTEIPPSALTGTTTIISNITYTVTVSSIFNASYDGFRAFDKSVTTFWATPSNRYSAAGVYNFTPANSLGGINGEYVYIQLSSAITVISYQLTVANDTYPVRIAQMATGWTILGSNNGTTWTSIDVRSSQSWTSLGESKAYIITTPASYTYYGIVVQTLGANPDTGLLSLGEWSLYTAQTPISSISSTIASSSLTVNNSNTFMYLGGSDGNENSLSYIGECLYFQRVLSSSEETILKSYLSNKWGIISPLTMTSKTLLFWVDAQALNSITPAQNGSGNVTITQVNDLSGNNRHLTVNAGTITHNPTLLYGFMPGFDFSSGTTSGLRTAAFTNTLNCTIIMVASIMDGIVTSGMFFQHGTNNTDISIERNGSTTQVMFQTNSDTNCSVNYGTFTTNVSLFNTPVIFYGTLSTGTVRNFSVISGGMTANTSFTLAGAASLTLGSKILYIGASDTNQSCDSYIYEVLYFDGVLSTTERQTVLDYLRNKWCIPRGLSTPGVSAGGTLTANPLSATSCTLSWTYPSGSVAVRITTTPATTTLYFNAISGVTSTTVTGLTANVRYTFTLQGISYGGINTTSTVTANMITTSPGSGGITTGPVTIGGQNYYIHIFTTSGSFIANSNTVCDILLVGGGGGAAGYQSGGAGAGGLVFITSYFVSPGTVTVTIGNGGTGVTAATAYGNPGQNTSFGSITAVGGARGVGTNNSTAGEPGGSGSGACIGSGNFTNQLGGAATQPSQAGESGTFGRGNAGGQNGNGIFPGGGGGAGSAGNTGANGRGGAGLHQVTLNSITYNFATIFNTTSYGQLSGGNIYFGGGGSGGYGGTPGLGGGGTGGGDFSGGTSGSANTGGGAGGAGNGFGGTNASGGSGIVMLRYLV